MKCLKICATIAVLLPTAAMGSPSLTSAPWGALSDGTAITRYTLTNKAGASASFMPLGAAVLSVTVPDRNGRMADVVLGYDKPSDYNTNNSPEFGLTIGRFANRIFGASFTLDGVTSHLTPTGRGNPPMTMHGGPEGFATKIWKASPITTRDGKGLRFTLVSPDGDQGFPGKMVATVTYVWTEDCRMIIDYTATTTKPTVVNLTQHSYFNMAGAGHGDVLNQLLRIDADFFTFALPNNQPTGEIRSVHGTPFDFTVAKPVGRDIDADDAQMKANRGYNQNYVLRRSPIPGQLAEAAELYDPVSGRKLTISTDQPGLFLYTANFISTTRPMKGGVTYPLRAGVAMEIGQFPDAPNQPHFPRTTLLPGQTFHARTVWAFTVG
jgi:aldose 1-epimerase